MITIETIKDNKNFLRALKSFMLFITLMFLASCVAESESPKKKKTSSNSSSGNTNNGGTTPSSQSDNMYWFTSEKITGAMTVNKDTQNIAYLRGNQIQNFLNTKNNSGAFHYTRQFCIVINFASSNYKQVRVKAVPISVTNFSTRKVERLFRIDLPTSEENTNSCDRLAGETILPASFSNGVQNVCVDPNSTTNCRGIISSSNIQLYEALPKIRTSSKVDTNRVDVSGMQIRIDLNSNSNNNGLSCTDSSCMAKGFDCCISGQCVKDGTERPNLSSSNEEVIRARAEFNTNPLSFINYPNVYFVCTNITRNPTPPGTGTTDPIADAIKRVQKYLPKWKCVNFYDLNSGTSSEYQECYPENGEILSKQLVYERTVKEVARLCGCVAPDDQIASACPDWKLKPIYRTALEIDSNIVDFACITPKPESPIGPITNLNVNVSSRTAPHRFFYLNEYKNQPNLKPKSFAYDTKKQSYSDFVYKQEGEIFSYLDENSKMGPVSGQHNINSIFGNMSIDLTKTQPAKMVTVELGRTYIISATSGYFTPCLKCAKDNWYETFLAHPRAEKGLGLQSTGYTTKRDEFAMNSTLGNYEDTIFGRACWLPATMIPFTHNKMATPDSTSDDPTLQRQNRLKAQAAMYINGYQRDWYGFNKGALIGSFDGVQWFAIGTGRRLTATTNKLFLAMNASFNDLAEYTDTVVNIIPDLGGNTAPDYDYDPELAFNDPKQNSAASCQRNHQCNNDADCVTQLGWEYTCADVTQIKTKWPVFNSDGTEIGNSEKTTFLASILENNQPTVVPKRCVYRGMGALCKQNFDMISNNINKKLLTCAPNFTCVSLGSNRFNEELIRSPNELDNVLFGKDANILGRPKDYVTANKALPFEAKLNIEANGALSVDSSGLGLCMPGKALTGSTLANHATSDSARRTDYISQIGSCNSTPALIAADNMARLKACPVFDSELNLINSVTDPINVITIDANGTSHTSLLNTILNQNSCGGEARHSVSQDSAFKSIEFPTLLVSKNIVSKGFAADACFRRAGSVCHTDLDCSPNKLHSSLLSTLGLSFFGNTRAEYRYWDETLICGQGTATPTVGQATYEEYDIRDNRCCREIGKDFSMYTSGTTTIIPDLGSENTSLDTAKMSFLDPKATGRYSRYSISKTATDNFAKTPKIAATTFPETKQWSVIDETGKGTCCGGGWIRKFSDGTNDWKVRNRLKLDHENFQCLNYRSFLSRPELQDPSNTTYYLTPTGFNYYSYLQDYKIFCEWPEVPSPVRNLSPHTSTTAEGASAFGCLQTPFADSDTGFEVIPPYKYSPARLSLTDPWFPYLGTVVDSRNARVTVALDVEGNNPPYFFTSEAPYLPERFKTNEHISVNTNYIYNEDPAGFKDLVSATYLPFYIPYKNDNSNSIVKIQFLAYISDDETKAPFKVSTSNITARRLLDATCSAALGTLKGGSFSATTFKAALVADPNGSVLQDGVPPKSDGAYAAWCITRESGTNRPIFLFIPSFDTEIPGVNYYYAKHAGFAIDFIPHEGNAFDRLHAGNPNYYLTKLGRLELLGVPQITYEPIYCTNSQETTVGPTLGELNLLLPGIFKTVKTKAEVDAQFPANKPSVEKIYSTTVPTTQIEDRYGNKNGRFAYQDKINHKAIFSGSEFACCTPLGKTTNSANKCCSGHAVQNANGALECKIPKGTNVNVYFNKFISGEGVGEELPGGGLRTTGTEAEIDFIESTGEIKLRQESYDRLFSLAVAYCDGTPDTGGAFGFFSPFENALLPLSIVDSDLDVDQDNPNVGYDAYSTGFKWNHHIYCK